MKFESLKSKTIHFKLIEENDAEFICSLRANPDLNKHLSPSTAIVDEQKKWIKNYKERENSNLEYYFIIYRNDNNEKVGTIRLYDFKDTPKSFCWGSWILNENKTRYAAIESALLVYKIAFEELNFEQSHFDVRRENIGVHNFHIKMGAIQVDGNEIDNFYIFPAKKYFETLPEYQNFLE